MRGVLFGIEAVIRLLSDAATIIHIGSIANGLGVTLFSAYAAIKAALRSYAPLGGELAPRRIRVNVIAKGPTNIDMMTAVHDEARETLTALLPPGRMFRSEEVADAALFPVGDTPSLITVTEL